MYISLTEFGRHRFVCRYDRKGLAAALTSSNCTTDCLILSIVNIDRGGLFGSALVVNVPQVLHVIEQNEIFRVDA